MSSVDINLITASPILGSIGVLINIILSPIGGIGVIIAIFFTLAMIGIESFRKKEEKEETLEDRINKLASALQESSHLITSVESEIQSRQQLVIDLQNDAQRYKKLISINKEQVDAIAQVFQGELQKESKKSFWQGVVINFIFFILGAFVTQYM